MRHLRLSLGLAALVLAVALTAPGALGAADPIEGVWLYGGGAVQVSRTGPDSFVGIVVAATKFTDCVHSYIQSQSNGRGSADISSDDATRLSFAGGSFRLSHEYLLFADERLTLSVVGGSFHDRSSKGRSVVLQVRVSATNFSGCPVGTTGSAILKDGRGRSADSFAVGICGIALLYVNSPKNQDFVKVRIWTASGDAGSGSSQPPPSGGPF